MQHYALIGKPLKHSFSKQYFEDMFERLGIDAQYSNYEIDTIDSLPELIKEHDLCGLNITAPFKKDVIKLLSGISKEAQELQAVNVVNINNGQLFGYNTDIIGVRKSLTDNIKGRDKALILGTGATSRTIALALKEKGINYLFVSRHKQGYLHYQDLTDELIKQHTIIINATPVGMFPDTDSCPPIPYEYITPSHLLFDVIYNPEQTIFLMRGKERGATTINGLQMLHTQAQAAWEIWNKEQRTKNKEQRLKTKTTIL